MSSIRSLLFEGINNAFRNSTRLDVARLAGGAFISQVFGFLTFPIVARFIPPEEFGIFSVFSAICAILSVGICLKFETAICIPKGHYQGNLAFCLSSLSAFLVSFFILLIIFVIYVLSPNYYWKQLPIVFLFFVPFYTFSEGIINSLRFLLSRNNNFKVLAQYRVFISGSNNFFRIFFVLIGLQKCIFLIIGSLLSQFLTILFLLRPINNSLTRILRFSCKRLWGAFLRYRDFPLYGAPAEILVTASQQMPSLILAKYFGPYAAGIYGISLQVLTLPANLVGGAIGQVFYQKAAEACHQKQLGAVVSSFFRKIQMFCLFPFIIFFAAGNKIIWVLLGENWREAGTIVQILSPWVYIGFTCGILISALNLTKNQKLVFRFHVTVFFTRVLSLFIGGELGSLNLAVSLYSITGIIAFLILQYIIFKHSGVPASVALKAGVFSLLLNIPHFFFWSPITQNSGASLTQFFIPCLCSLTYFLSMLYWEHRY